MKAVVLFCAVVLTVGRPAAAIAPCDQIVHNLNDRVAEINQDATSYWGHRANFVDLLFGQSRDQPNNKQRAEQEKAKGDPLKAGMPDKLRGFKGLLTAAQAQNCLSPDQLSAITEPTTKLAKRVNFDQFPPEVPVQSTVEIGPPRLPR